MAHLKLVLHVRVALIDQRIQHGVVAQVRLGKLVAELSELGDERCGGVDTCRFSIGNFQFVINKHANILVERLRFGLLGIVFMKEIFKFAETHVLSGHIHQHWIGIFCCQSKQRRTDDAHCEKLLFH